MRALFCLFIALLFGCGPAPEASETDVIHAVLYMGQSNVPGVQTTGLPPGVPLPAARYWIRGISGGITDVAWHDLQQWTDSSTSFGPALAMGVALNARWPGKVAILQISRGGSSMAQWQPGQFFWTAAHDTIVTARALLLAQFPGETQVYWHFVWDQGETEQQSSDLPTVQAWALGYTNVKQSWEALLGQSLRRIIIGTNANISGATFPGVLAAQQTSVADKLVPTTSFAVTVDGLHRDSPTNNTVGNLTAAAIIADWTEPTMGTLSATARSALVDHQTNKSAYTPEVTQYVHWYAGGVALTAGNSPGYVKNTATNNTTTWPNAASRIKSNGVAFTQTPSGTGLSPDEIRITNNATEGAGTILASDTFTPVVWSVAGGPVSCAIGGFTITAPTNVATGGFTNAVVHSLYNLMFGGTGYTQLATTYLSYWAGDPAGAGAIAGGSVAMTQASQWDAAVSGQAQSILPVTLAQQVTGTYFAIHDTAAGAGVLLMTCTRLASIGASGTILAGQLLTTML